MHGSNNVCLPRTNGSPVVLLARIVDGAGRPILPWQVAVIEFSVITSGAQRPPAALVVSDVLLPRLVNDDMWSVDVAGYNFRHTFYLSELATMPPTGSTIELRYVF